MSTQQSGDVTRHAGILLACVGALAMAGCTYYVPPPTTVPVTTTTTTPANFDRSFSAAAGALSDQGYTLTRQDQANGVIVGARGNSSVTANVNRQADGSVRVEFRATDASDPSLIDRVTRSYQTRMGR